MKITKLSTVVLGSSFVVSSIASAQSAPPIYFRAETGYSWSRDADLHDRDFTGSPAICADAACSAPGRIDDDGHSWLLGGAVGYRFNPNIRAELALDHRFKYELGQTLGSGTTFGANVSNWSLMANGYYDFDVGMKLKPYVMGGLGWAHNRVYDFNSVNPTGSAASGSHDAFAWSLGAGVGYPLNNRLTLDVGYRYVDLGKLETDAGVGTLTGLASPYSGASGKLRSNELVVGVRW